MSAFESKNEPSEAAGTDENDHSKTKASRTTKIAAMVTVSISGIICIAVIVMLIFSEREPDVRILDNSIQIKAAYGLTVDFSDISDAIKSPHQ
jgi:hypothetical protein